jgi:hypothetical protein
VIAQISGTTITRLRGLDDQEFELELRNSPTLMPGTAAMDPRGLSVRFWLRDADISGGAPDSSRTPLHPKEVSKLDSSSQDVAREIFQLERERTDLEIVAAKARRQMEIGTKDADEVKRAEAQLAAVNRRIRELKDSLAQVPKAGGRTVIDTTFRMEEGETVVVGTSKAKGGKALIALLTATADRSTKGSSK